MSKKSSTFAADFACMSRPDHYIIDLSRLQVGVHEFEIQLDDDFFAAQEKSEVLNGHIAAKVTLNLREDDYMLNIAVQGTVFVVCDRCLDPMPLEIADEQVIDASDEPECPDGTEAAHTLDLTWLVYEIVSINIPIVHSHQPGGCNKQMDLLLQSHLCAEAEPDEIVNT